MKKLFNLFYTSVINPLVFGTFMLVLWSVSAYAADDNSMFTSGVPVAPRNFSEFSCIVIKLALDFIPYLIVIAIGAFLQGLIKYVGNGDSEEKRTEGTKMMVYGILGFFFMVSIYGILSIFTQSFGLALVIPQFKSDTTFSCQ